MDPHENVREQRRLCALIRAQPDSQAGDWELARLAERLADLVQALDRWRLSGGFDPYQLDLGWPP